MDKDHARQVALEKALEAHRQTGAETTIKPDVIIATAAAFLAFLQPEATK